ncbi:MAG: RNA polymerase sigma factor [Saprospirales bacterium]|nr:MAG: RNA polymerase sigma factor [Saprospirales bacterium]
MQVTKVSDKEIIDLLKRKGTLDQGLRLFVKVYGKDLYGFLRTFSLQQADADEIFQETLIKLMEKARSFKGQSSLKTWVWTIARNKTIDHKRKVKRLNIHEAEGLENSLREDSFFNGDEWLIRLHKAVSELPDAQREVFVLRYFEEMRYDQIAKITAKSKSTLKTSFHYATIKVAEKLKKQL